MSLLDMPESLAFGDFEIHFDKRELSRNGVVIRMEPKVFDLLSHLIRHRDRVVGKGELLDSLWPDLEMSEASLTSGILRLRRLLSGRGHLLIKTYYGKGYRFVGECRFVSSQGQPSQLASTLEEQAARRAVFVGRVEELQRLEAVAARARAGSGELVLLAGREGIGKTRLMDEFRHRAARDGMRPVGGRCYEDRGMPPFWPWVQILRSAADSLSAEGLRTLLRRCGPGVLSLAPELRDLAGRSRPRLSPRDGADARQQLFRHVVEFLRGAASSAPLVILLDDLQWADSSSLMLLEFLSRDVSSMPILVVAGYRAAEVESNREQEAIFAKLTSAAGRTLTIEELTSSEVDSLARSLLGPSVSPGEIDRVYQATGGNPLLVEQVVHERTDADTSAIDGGWMGDGLGVKTSEGLRRMLEQRLSRLDSATREVLTLASTIGVDFEVGLVERIRQGELADDDTRTESKVEQALAQAMKVGLVTARNPRAPRLQFSSTLVRDIAYRRQSLGQRARRHRRIAETLVGWRDRSSTAGVSTIAEHFLLGAASGAIDEAVEWITRAAEMAAAQFAFDSAVQRYRQALSLLPLVERRDLSQETSITIGLAEAQWSCGDAEAARATAERAGALARQQGDGRLLARAALACGSKILAQANTDERFVRFLEEARENLPVGDDSIGAKLLGRLAWARYYDDDHGKQREQLSQEAVAMARRLDDPQALLWALNDRHRALMCPDHHGERLAIARELVAGADALGAVDLQALGNQQLAWDLLEIGERKGAEKAMSRVVELTRDFQNAVRWSAMLWQGMIALVEGRWADAERLRVQTFEFGRRIDEGFAILTAGTQFVTLRTQMGELDGLPEQIRLVIAAFPNLTFARAALAYVRLVQGEVEDARQEANQTLARGIESLRWDTTWLPTVGMLGMVYAGVGDVARCHELIDALSPYADRVPILGVNATACFGPVSRPLALLSATVGKWEQAESYFEAAIDQAKRVGAKPWVANTLFEQARYLIRRGNRLDLQRGRRLIRTVIRMAGEVGIERLAKAALPLLE